MLYTLESDLGCTSRVCFDNVTLTSQSMPVQVPFWRSKQLDAINVNKILLKKKQKNIEGLL